MFEPSLREQQHEGHATTAMDVEADDFCWICLDDANKPGAGPLLTPCACPRKVHPCCLARWQLQQAGRAEETHCRFCNTTLADWKTSLTPETLKPEVERVQPIMVVYFEGEIHRIPVKQGNDGLHEFTGRIRELFRLPEDVDISLTFGCKEPMSGQHLKLEGIGAFDAAVHCASVAAAERQHKLRSTGGGAAPAAGSAGGAGDGNAASAASEHSAGGASSSGGSTLSAASAPIPAQSRSPSGTRRTSNHRSTTQLRHSTGSSWPSVPSITTAATTIPTAAPQLQPMQTDSPQAVDAPTPFMQAPPAWTYSQAGSPPLLHDEQLLLQQHLEQLAQPAYTAQSSFATHTHTHTHAHAHAAAPYHTSASIYSPSHHTPTQPPLLQQSQLQFPTYNSLDLLAPGTPRSSLLEPTARHASPLPSLLSTPSLPTRMSSRIAGMLSGPAAGALSADNLLSMAGAALHHLAAPCSQHSRPYTTAMAVEPSSEPASPPTSLNGMDGVNGMDLRPADGGSVLNSGSPMSVATPARRARRSSSQFVEAPLQRAPEHDVGVEPAFDDGQDSEGLSPDDHLVGPGTGITGRLRGSLKELSRKFVRSLHTTFAHRHPSLHAGGSGAGRDGASVSDELQYQIEQHVRALQYGRTAAAMQPSEPIQPMQAEGQGQHGRRH